jgi:hypothetical protein
MTRQTQRYDRVVSTLSRRQLIAGAGTLAAGGLGVVALGGGARAQVSVDGLQIPDANLTAEAPTPAVRVDIGYEYDVGTAPVAALGFTLAVDGTVVAEDKLDTTRSTLSETTTLNGAIADSEAWRNDDFAPEVGGSLTREVVVTVGFDVLESGGSSIAGDSVTTTVPVSVSHPQETKYIASVGASGEIIDTSE